MKRTASDRIKRMTSRISEFNPQVTLFQPAELEESPRRSKRTRTEFKTEPIADLEDLKLPPDVPGSSKKHEVHAVPSDASSTPQKREVQSPKKAKAIRQVLDHPHPAPPNWRETYEAIKAMRSRFVAPVDTMGCQQAQVKESDAKNRRYATLVSLMLSSQTKDEITNAAVENLREALGGSISIEGMIAAEESVISRAIAKVGFWNRKTGYLKRAAIQLRDDFNSDVPDTVDELCSLPGVGPKMAFLALQIAWDKHDGIGVDVHVHRITNLLGWHKPPTKTPEQTRYVLALMTHILQMTKFLDERLNLQSWLPKDLYGDINHMLVGFGQVICLPVSPRCDHCDLSTRGLCPSAKKVNTKNRKAIIYTNSEESPPRIEIALDEETEDKK